MKQIEKLRVYKTKIPQVIGAIGGIYIEILCNDIESGFDYFSGKQKYTINTEVIVGANLMIRNIATGFSGSFHDARIFRWFSICRKVENGEILQNPAKKIKINRKKCK